MKTEKSNSTSGDDTTSSKFKAMPHPDGHRALSAHRERPLRKELTSRKPHQGDEVQGKPRSDHDQTESKPTIIKRDTYLSVDADFWARGRVDLGYLRHVVHCVGADNIAAAVEHDSILCHLRRYGEDCKVLVNLDRHSDLSGVMNITHENGDGDTRRMELHSGSWVDYTPWPVRKEFVWAYPDFVSREEGRCDDFSSFETPFGQIPQREPTGLLYCDWDSEWQSLRRCLAQRPNYGIDLGRVRAASITLSPRFCGPGALEAFKTLACEFNLELLDVLAPNLAAMKPNVAQVEKKPPEKDYGPVPLHANPQDILSVEWAEDPESQLNWRPGYFDAPKTRVREMLRGFCWAETAPTVGSLVRADGAWYNLDSDAPVDGCKDRAKCPTELWKVTSVRHFLAGQLPEWDDRGGKGRPINHIDAVGQFIEQYVVKNRNGSEGVARRLIGGII